MKHDYTDTYDNPTEARAPDVVSQLVINQYLRSKNELIDMHRDRWDEWYKAFRSHIDFDESAIRSNLVIPLIASHVEAYAPRLVGTDPIVEVWPQGPEDVEKARQHRIKILYDWQHADIPMKLIHFAKQSLIYGTAVMKVYHRRETAVRVVKEMALMDRFMSTLGIPTGRRASYVDVEKLVTIYDDPDVDVLELDEFYPDPDGKCLKSCEWVIHRFKKSLWEIERAENKDGEPLYDPEVVKQLKEEAEYGNQESPTEDSESLRSEREETFGSGSTPFTVDPQKRRFTLIEKWSDERVEVVVLERPDLPPIRNERNRYGMKPFVIYTPIPDPNSFYGIAASELLYSIQKELTTMHNARMDHLLQSVHMMMTIRHGSGINPRNIRIRPAGHIMLEDHEDIKFLQPPPLEFATYREDDNLRMWAQQVSGATDPFMGMNAAGGGTATEATILSQSSGSRASLMFKILGKQALNRLGRLLIAINRTEMTFERQLPIISADIANIGVMGWETVNPADLSGGSNLDLDVKIDVSEAQPETKMFRRKELIEAIQAVGGLYGQQNMNHPAMETLITELLDTYDIPNARLLVQQPTVPEGAQEAAIKGQQEGISQAENMGQELASALGEMLEGGTTSAT